MTVEKQEWCRAVPPGLPAGRGEGVGSAAVRGPHSRETERWWGLLIHLHPTRSPPNPYGAAKQRAQNQGPHTQAGPALSMSLLSFTSLFLAQREQDQCISWGGRPRGLWGNQGSADPLAELGACYFGGHGLTPPSHRHSCSCPHLHIGTRLAPWWTSVA